MQYVWNPCNLKIIDNLINIIHYFYIFNKYYKLIKLQIGNNYD